eukprot:175718_1
MSWHVLSRIPSEYEGTVDDCEKEITDLLAICLYDNINLFLFWVIFYYVSFKLFMPKAQTDVTATVLETPSLIHSLIASITSIPILLYADFFETNENMLWLFNMSLIHFICYFILDSIFCDLFIWRIHHIFAIIMGFNGLISLNPIKYITVSAYGYLEIGGLLYHISKSPTLRQSLTFRCLFVIAYIITRCYFIQLIIDQFAATFKQKSVLYFYIGLISGIMSVATLLVNIYFIIKQIQNLHKMYQKQTKSN